MRHGVGPRHQRLACAGALLLVACGRDAPWFVENASERGLDFVHARGEARYWFPEIMGSGLALVDVDADGDLDLYLVQSGDLSGPSDAGRNRLYRNDGRGTFVDASAGSGADDPGYGMGVAVGDYDGDGLPDLYVTNVGRNTLLRNEGGGRFRDATEEAGVGHEAWGTSCAFFDGDADGDLDLYVVNYLHWDARNEIECGTSLGQDYCSPNSYESPAQDVLYENLGDGSFRDVSREAGIADVFGNGLGVSVGDFGGDGRLDVYVANDMMPNQLWINDGGLRFHDDALLLGCAVNRNGESEAGMGTVAFDLESDGDLDLFLTHLRQETNTLYVNAGGSFSDRTAPLGLAAPSLRHTGFGACFADFDQDGVLDLFVANGSVSRNRPEFDPEDPYAEPDQLFRGLESGGFEEVEPRGATAIEASRGAAAGDLDGDGDLDLVVVDSNSRVRLLENVTARGAWLIVKVVDEAGSDQLGAAVSVEAGGRLLRRHVAPATSYCSSLPAEVHFGFGNATGSARVTVLRPDGTRALLEEVPLNRRVVLTVR